jgi:hypothetical protein
VKLQSILGAALLLGAGAASGNPLERATLMPTLSVRLAFDDSAWHSAPTRLTARFDLHAPYLAGVTVMPLKDRPRDVSIAMPAGEPMPLVRFFEFNATGRKLESASVLGHRVIAGADRLGAAEGTHSGSNWLWWTVGGIAATAVTLALASSGSDDSSDRGPSGPDGECNGVSGNVNVAPEPSADPVILGPDCEVAGNDVPSPGP